MPLSLVLVVVKVGEYYYYLLLGVSYDINTILAAAVEKARLDTRPYAVRCRGEASAGYL
jgi:hypothetical protein